MRNDVRATKDDLYTIDSKLRLSLPITGSMLVSLYAWKRG